MPRAPRLHAFQADQSTLQDWTRSERYHNPFLLPKDDVLEAALKHNSDSGLPDIAVSEAEGQFLNLLSRSIGTKRILEVGALGGFSAINFARSIPEDGQVVTLGFNPLHARVATENLKRARVDKKVTVIVGRAADSLAKMQPEESFNLAFIDADKPSNLIYFKQGKRLVRPGGIMIADNAVLEGRVADPEYNDAWVEGTRDILRAIKDDEDIEATILATVGARGFDGFIR